MDMKKARDLARKENKATKKNDKGKAKAVKAFAATAVDSVVSAGDALTKKASEVKAAIVQTAKAGKADAQHNAKRRG